MCCAEGFECLSNGLCNDYRYENYERVLRGGCTDKDWGEGCPQTCTSIWPQGDEIVHVCSNQKFCCGRSNACCDDAGAVFFEFGNPQVIAVAGKTQATSAPQGENEQTTASSQPTKVGEQDPPQKTQSQQQDPPQNTQSQQQDPPQNTLSQHQDVATPATTASTGSLDEPTDTPAPANTGTYTSGDNTAETETTRVSQSDATGTAARTNPNLSAAGSGAGPVATNTANNSNNNNNTPTPPEKNNHTVAIAAGVGVGVGVLVFLLVVAGCWHVRRKRQRPGLRSRNIFEIGESSTPATEVADSNGGAGAREKGSDRVFELDSHAMGVELPVRHEAEEVHGESAEGKKWPDMFR